MVIKNLTPRVLLMRGQFVMPGLNVISDAAWARIRETPFVQGLLKTEGLVEIPAEQASPSERGAPPAESVTNEQKQAAEIANMSIRSAVAVVKEMDNQLLLRLLASNETRKQVQSAAEKRLEAIEAEMRRRIEEHDDK